MGLSDLVRLKNTVIQYGNFLSVKQAAGVVASSLSTIVTDSKYQSEIDDVVNFINPAITEMEWNVTLKIKNIVIMIDKDIEEIVLKDSTRNYSDRICTVRDSRDKELPLPSKIKSELLGRIQLHADWHFPGMEIGTHDGELTLHLVGCDPLYIVDAFPENLVDTKARFTPEYQGRVRLYCLGYKPDDSRIEALPINQFGLIFSWNTFNYMSFAEIQRYLVDIFSMLRPGGIFIFSFNDGSTYRGAQHVEWGNMSNMPKDLMFKLIKEVGFELVIYSGTETNRFDISWVEVKKPGELSTIKAHPTLGEIRNIE